MFVPFSMFPCRAPSGLVHQRELTSSVVLVIIDEDRDGIKHILFTAT